MTTQYTNRLILVVTAAVASQCNTAAKEVAGNGGEKTFTVGLSANGLAPPTHFWCSWQLTAAQAQAIRDKLKSLETLGSVKTFVCDHFDPAIAVPTPEAVLAQLGLKRIQTTL